MGVSIETERCLHNSTEGRFAVPQSIYKIVMSPSYQKIDAAEGLSLKAKLRRAERKRKIKAAGLVAPLFFFLLITFIIPIMLLLYRAVDNPEILAVMPKTAQTIQKWGGAELPGESVFAALAADLKQARKDRTIGKAGKRLNYDITGFRSLVLKTARKISRLKTEPASYRDKIIDMDKRWGDLLYWSAVKRAAAPYTDFYVLSAMDLKRDRDGNIVRTPAKTRANVSMLLGTDKIKTRITVPIRPLFSAIPIPSMATSTIPSGAKPVKFETVLSKI